MHTLAAALVIFVVFWRFSPLLYFGELVTPMRRQIIDSLSQFCAIPLCLLDRWKVWSKSWGHSGGSDPIRLMVPAPADEPQYNLGAASSHSWGCLREVGKF